MRVRAAITVAAESPLCGCTHAAVFLAEDIDYELSEESITTATSSLSALLALAQRCDDSLLAGLESNLAGCPPHVTENVLTLIGAVERAVHPFVTSSRRHTRIADKQLEVIACELQAAMKTLESFLQQLGAGDDTSEFTEDSLNAISRILGAITGLPSASAFLTRVRSDVLSSIDTASHVGSGISPSVSKVVHAPWLTRGDDNQVTITACDASGEPAYGLKRADVRCAADRSAIGWSASIVSVKRNVVTLKITLSSDCSSVVCLDACIAGSSIPIVLKVCTFIARVFAACVVAIAFVTAVKLPHTP